MLWMEQAAVLQRILRDTPHPNALDTPQLREHPGMEGGQRQEHYGWCRDGEITWSWAHRTSSAMSPELMTESGAEGWSLLCEAGEERLGELWAPAYLPWGVSSCLGFE